MAAPSPTMSKDSQDGTQFNYNTFSQNTPTSTEPGLIYQGGTYVPQGFTFLRLTETDTLDKPTGNSAGRADSLAFFIALVNTTIPIDSTTGGNLGIFGPKGTTPNLFAVEFDTFINDWDPKDRHIGIDIGSRKSVSTESFDSGTGELVTAHINYHSKTSSISVGATSGQQKASLSCVFDLKNLLPQQVQVGISSAGGDPVTVHGLHDVFSWYFRSYYN
ncbi:hypothetical protein ACS0TY_018525 [Phlomoides rotata]